MFGNLYLPCATFLVGPRLYFQAAQNCPDRQFGAPENRDPVFFLPQTAGWMGYFGYFVMISAVPVGLSTS